MTRSTSQQYLHDRPKRVVTGSISSTTLNTFCKEGVPLEEPLSRDSYESSSTDSVTVASGSEHPSRHSSENVLSMGLDEVARLKNELAAAKTQIARMDEELCQSRITKHTIDQALEPLNESVLVRRSELNNQAMEDLQASFNTLSRPSSAKEDLWNQEGHQMDEDDIRVGKLGNKASAIWASGSVRGTYRPTPFAQNEQPYNLTPSASWNAVATRAWHQPQLTSGPAHQPFAPSANLQYNAATMAKEENPFKLGLQPQVALEPDQYHADHSLRRNLGLPNRPITANGPSHRSPTVWGNDYTSFAHPLAASSRTSSPMTQTSFQHLQMPNLHTSQVPRPIGTRLSPTAAEFNAEPAGHSPWNSQVCCPKTASLQST